MRHTRGGKRFYNRSLALPRRRTLLSVVLLAARDNPILGAGLHPQLGFPLDRGQQVWHLGDCSTKAPGIALLPQLPSNASIDRICAFSVAPCRLRMCSNFRPLAIDIFTFEFFFHAMVMSHLTAISSHCMQEQYNKKGGEIQQKNYRIVSIHSCKEEYRSVYICQLTQDIFNFLDSQTNQRKT